MASSLPAKLGAVIFDLDGTLIDSAADIATALNAVRAVKALPPLPREAVVPMIGGGSEALLRQCFAAEGMALAEAEIAALHGIFKAEYTTADAQGQHFPHSLPYPGLLELLARLRDGGICVAVCTNKAEELTLSLLGARDMVAAFDVISAGRPGRPQKPDPAPLRDLLSTLGVAADRAVMVGDSAADINCARAAGVASIGVTFGYTATPMAQLGADAVIDHFAEFEDAAVRLFA